LATKKPRIDHRKGDRHTTPRKGSRRKSPVLAICIGEELLLDVKQAALERGEPLAEFVRESLQARVVEQKASPTAKRPDRAKIDPVLTEFRRMKL